MSVETLSPVEQKNNHSELLREDFDVRHRLLDIADQIAAMELQFRGSPLSERRQLETQKEALIQQLTGERPGHALLNEVLLLASLYGDRTTEATLPGDDSKVRAFGTRDRFGLYLEETYILHEKPDGGFHYLVRRQTDQTSLIYEIDDQAGLRIKRQGNEFIPAYHQPVEYQPGSESYEAAARSLLLSSLAATGGLRQRGQAERTKYDAAALGMVETSTFARKFLDADSSDDLEAQVSSLMDVSPMLLSQDALALIVKSYR